MYLHESIYDTFMEKFLAKVKNLKVGDPMLDETDLGLKVNANEFENTEVLVVFSVKKFAIIAFGGGKI